MKYLIAFRDIVEGGRGIWYKFDAYYDANPVEVYGWIGAAIVLIFIFHGITKPE